MMRRFYQAMDNPLNRLKRKSHRARPRTPARDPAAAPAAKRIASRNARAAETLFTQEP